MKIRLAIGLSATLLLAACGSHSNHSDTNGTAVENSVSVFNIESDEMKGRIIGRDRTHPASQLLQQLRMPHSYIGR